MHASDTETQGHAVVVVVFNLTSVVLFVLGIVLKLRTQMCVFVLRGGGGLGVYRALKIRFLQRSRAKVLAARFEHCISNCRVSQEATPS